MCGGGGMAGIPGQQKTFAQARFSNKGKKTSF